MSSRAPSPWETAGYSDIVAAARQDRDIAVEFANGDVVRVAAATFGINDADFDVELGPDDGLNVRVTTSHGRTIDITWTQIRSADDPRFSHELRRRDADQSRRVGLRLKALREDRNLNQRDLAGLVGMAASQLSKIESGKSDLRVSTVQSLLRAMGAELSDLAGPDALEVSHKTLRKRAEAAGVSTDVFERLVTASQGFIVKTLSRAFGWSPQGVAAGVLRTPRLDMPVRLKSHQPGEPHESPLMHLAHEVAKAVRSGARPPKYEEPPSDPDVIREEAKEQGHVTLASLLTWMWQRGIPVVPLLGRRGFSAAVWSIDGMPVVILKEARDLAVYWLFDLAHELGHIVLRHITHAAVVDVDSPRPHSSTDSDEDAASKFALDVLLPGHRQLLAGVRAESRGSYLRFKSAVETVAAKAGVSAGLLGMVAAYELVDIGEDKDRWGSASNLAKADGPGRPVAEEIVTRFVAVDAMSEVDAALIRAAVLTGSTGALPGDV
jgi:transcriptional regulator with XRE-family HTH domain/Zn-dependent peptidase ImmA (M78 family)